VSLTLAVLFYAVQPLVGGIEPLLGLAKYLAYINLALVLFNLIPGWRQGLALLIWMTRLWPSRIARWV
jgi:hypothetical protein